MAEPGKGRRVGEVEGEPHARDSRLLNKNLPFQKQNGIRKRGNVNDMMSYLTGLWTEGWIVGNLTSSTKHNRGRKHHLRDTSAAMPCVELERTSY